MRQVNVFVFIVKNLLIKMRVQKNCSRS